MMGAQEHINNLKIEIQILMHWKYKYLNFAKVGKLWKDASPQIQDRKLAGNAAIWDIHGIQKKKKNTIIKTRQIQAHFLLQSEIILKEEIHKTSFEAIGNIRWIAKKEETLWQNSRYKTKTFLAAEIIMEFKTRKETHTDKEKKISCCNLQAQKGHLLFCNLRYSWNSRG